MILVGCSCSRMERHTSKPFDFGINKSHRISSGRLRNASSSPASPSFASRTFQSSRVKSCASTRRFSASSSMIKTRDIVWGDGCVMSKRAFATETAFLTQYFRVVPRCAARRHCNGDEQSGYDCANEQPAENDRPERLDARYYDYRNQRQQRWNDHLS